jgi:NADH-quinone oxidoreductase subunit L
VFIEPESGANFWHGSVAFNEHLMHRLHETPVFVKLLPVIVMLAGLAIAWWAYIRNTSIPGRFVAQYRPLYLFLLNKWYFDELYHLIFVRPAMWLGRLFWKKGDEGTIDRFGPDGIAALIVRGTGVTARLQSGYVYTYAFVMLIGIAGATTWAMAR